MLIRHLPIDSALVAALNGGTPAWTTTDHLLADLWALTVKVHSGDKKRHQPIDHPVRAEMAAKAKAKAKRALRAVFLQRKNRYDTRGGE